MSPEQAKGLRSIDQRTDIWSLGAVLYQALTGRTPHHDLETLGQLIIAICSESPAPVQDYAPWVSPELSSVVRGALTLDVEQRFQNAPALFEALRALQPGGIGLHESMLVPLGPHERTHRAARLEPVEARSGVGSSTAGPTVNLAGLNGTQQGLARTTRPTRKSPAPLVLAAVVTVLAGGGAAAYFGLVQRHPRDVPHAAAPDVSAVPTSPSAPAAVDGGAPSAPVTPALSEQVVHLAVAPAGVDAEVDGRPMETSSGVVELRGALGSTHRVVLRFAGQQLVRDVAITQSGALPDRLLLAAPSARGRAPRAVKSAAAEPAPAAPAVVAKPVATKPGAGALDRTFE